MNRTLAVAVDMMRIVSCDSWNVLSLVGLLLLVNNGTSFYSPAGFSQLAVHAVTACTVVSL